MLKLKTKENIDKVTTVERFGLSQLSQIQPVKQAPEFLGHPVLGSTKKKTEERQSLVMPECADDSHSANTVKHTRPHS